jgi:hypothetical protein
MASICNRRLIQGPPVRISNPADHDCEPFHASKLRALARLGQSPKDLPRAQPIQADGTSLDEACQWGEIVGVRTGRTLALLAMLAVQPISMLADNTVSQPNPVGEAVYRPDLLRGLLPVAVIICALSLGWLLHAAQRKAKVLVPHDVGSPHG